MNADDYIYEEFDESGESIDRKDSGGSQTSNHIISIPSKDSELHKFLNLPVHYSSASKFPLISSSYANTKVCEHNDNFFYVVFIVLCGLLVGRLGDTDFQLLRWI